MEQMRNWCCCQLCGRVVAAEDAWADGWLVGPWRNGVRVIRCYEHWSEWAMRTSGVGRTTGNRTRMARGRERAAQQDVQVKPIYEPFPLEDR